MEIIAGPDLPHVHLPAPSVCFLCEGAPQQSVERVVDTALDYWPDKGYQVVPLTGRKFVCEGCAHHIANALGYVRGPEHDGVVSDRAALQAELDEARKAADISGLIARTVAEAVAAATPVPPKKTAPAVKTPKE